MTTLSGPFGGVLESVANTLADTPAFRVWIDDTYDPEAERTAEEETAVHAAAYARVHFYTQRDSGWTLPAVFLKFGENTRQGRLAFDSFNVWVNGSMLMMFEAASAELNENALHENNLTFMDDINGIISGMQTVLAESVGGVYIDQAGGFGPEGMPVASALKEGEFTNSIRWVWSMELSA